jgi:murein DD-endopeptidase MepM/ murein hydrolase activator NlpD
MRCVDEPGRSLRVLRYAVLATISVAAVSCSSDTHRFESDKYFRSRTSSNQTPANAPANEVTGSVQQKRSAIQSSPLPPPPNASAPGTRPVVTGIAGGSKGMASYEPPTVIKSDVTGSVQPVAAARPGWNWEGGTAITVQKGDTIDALVTRYGVPASAIAEANNIPNGTALKPGQRLVIPKYEVTGSTVPRPAGNAPRTAAPAISAPATSSSSQHVHVVAPGETLMALSRKYHKPLAEIAKANRIEPHTLVKVGDRIVIPGVRTAPQAAVKPTTPAPAAMAQAPQPKPVAAPKVASIPAAPVATPTASVVTPAARDPEPPKTKTDVTSAMPKFRWPVNGRVITAFGPKPSGQQNDGINVSVPEGTPIKAAEDGVVAYAGNELKTYGNLVLVRHSNGYVTAYAHASEIMVKRDDPVKRGQIIAKSGQTGNVAAPQLHFEIRKGSTPVDPAPFLDKGGNG